MTQLSSLLRLLGFHFLVLGSHKISKINARSQVFQRGEGFLPRPHHSKDEGSKGIQFRFIQLLSRGRETEGWPRKTGKMVRRRNDSDNNDSDAEDGFDVMQIKIRIK